MKKLQDNAAVSGQNLNNTSSSFMLPSEFKKSWETLVQEGVLDVFGEFLEDYSLFVRLVRSAVRLVLEQV